ncbi:MAG TPA: hypothetical protein VFY95_09350 [Sphingomicrobium sp.]|jgi:hypothetical protein
MKRLIASFAALAVLAGPAFATTTSTQPVKMTKQQKKQAAKLAQKNAAHNAKTAAAPKKSN